MKFDDIKKEVDQKNHEELVYAIQDILNNCRKARNSKENSLMYIQEQIDLIDKFVKYLEADFNEGKIKTSLDAHSFQVSNEEVNRILKDSRGY